MVMIRNIWKSDLFQFCLITFNLELPLKITIEIPSVIIVIRFIFSENNKFYPQVFLDEYLYKYKNAG